MSQKEKLALFSNVKGGNTNIHDLRTKLSCELTPFYSVDKLTLACPIKVPCDLLPSEIF